MLLGHARAGNIRLDLSENILKETTRVLRDKFHWNGHMLNNARSKLLATANFVAPRVELRVITEDPDDNHVLECALEAGSDFIVSEDKDLLRLHRFGNTQIVDIANFAGLVNARLAYREPK